MEETVIHREPDVGEDQRCWWDSCEKWGPLPMLALFVVLFLILVFVDVLK